MIKSGKQLSEMMSVIYCFNRNDFIEMFGKNEWTHYAGKLTDVGVFKFISYLDSDNVEIVFKHATKKIEAFHASEAKEKKANKVAAQMEESANLLKVAKRLERYANSDRSEDYNQMMEELFKLNQTQYNELSCLITGNSVRSYIARRWDKVQYIRGKQKRLERK